MVIGRECPASPKRTLGWATPLPDRDLHSGRGPPFPRDRYRCSRPFLRSFSLPLHRAVSIFEPVTSIRHCAAERRCTVPLPAAAIRTAAHNGLTDIASPQPCDFYCGIIRLLHWNTVLLVVLTQEKHRCSIPFSSNARRLLPRITVAAVGCVARGQRPQDSDLQVFVTGG
jgi:hypothetical protein